MPLSMSQASLPTLEITLNALSGVLGKAEAFAKARKIDDTVMLRSRIAPDMFDLVWCRLMLSYLPDLAPAYAELARVCRDGGEVMVSDFHAAAIQAGHRQTFRDTKGMLHEIIHYSHDAGAHEAAAAAAGLTMTFAHDGVVGSAIRPIYERANRLDVYTRDEGLAVVALFLFQKS